MAKPIDLSNIIGKKYNSLIILKESSGTITKGGNKKRTITCVCDCGIIKDFILQSVLNGYSKSCGCYNLKKCSERAIKRNSKHNLYYTSEYNAWQNMKKRCLNPKHKSYKDYGGRGITICESWIVSFENFISDMGFKKDKKLSIERIDNNKGYSKDNCVWANKTKQSRNVRNNVFFIYKGEKKCVSEWSEIFNISRYKTEKYLILNAVKSK